MFVEQFESEFKQFRLTIENEEEAQVLWHLINCELKLTQPYFEKNRYQVPKDLAIIKHQMFVTIDESYRPDHKS